MSSLGGSRFATEGIKAQLGCDLNVQRDEDGVLGFDVRGVDEAEDALVCAGAASMRAAAAKVDGVACIHGDNMLAPVGAQVVPIGSLLLCNEEGTAGLGVRVVSGRLVINMPESPAERLALGLGS